MKDETKSCKYFAYFFKITCFWEQVSSKGLYQQAFCFWKKWHVNEVLHIYLETNEKGPSTQNPVFHATMFGSGKMSVRQVNDIQISNK